MMDTATAAGAVGGSVVGAAVPFFARHDRYARPRPRRFVRRVAR